LQGLQVHAVLVVRLKGHAVAIELLRELGVLQLVPFVLRGAVFLELLEALRVKEFLLEAASLEEHALVSLDDESLGVEAVLVADDLLELLLGLALYLVALLLDGVLNGVYGDALLHADVEGDLAEEVEVAFYHLDSLLGLVALLFLPVLLIVVRVVPRVQHVVLHTLLMPRQRLQVVRPDEPLRRTVLLGQGALDVLQVIVSRQVQRVARRHVVIEQAVVLDQTELLLRVIVVA
jgi:hypothetical protein